MKNIIDSEPIAKYLQLRRILEQEIGGGRYAVGDKLCTEAELMERYQVSANTVIRALKDLEHAGMITRRRGRGTFLSSHRPRSALAAQMRTLFLNGDRTLDPPFMVPNRSLTWFIGYEMHRGIINSFDGRVRIVTDAELQATAPAADRGSRCAITINPPPGTIEFLKREQIPYAVIGQTQGIMTPRPNTIGRDSLHGICEGMSHLIHDLGHRDIAFITTAIAPHPDRKAGYSIGLQSFEIPYREELVVKVSGVGDQEAGYRAMKQLIESGVSFTAAFVDTDIKALGAIQALKEAGRRVPEDVSILGFDDVPGMDQSDPPLTTVRAPYFEIGAEAVKLVEERMAKQGADVPGRLVNTRLIIRGSCAPCRSR